MVFFFNGLIVERVRRQRERVRIRKQRFIVPLIHTLLGVFLCGP